MKSTIPVKWNTDANPFAERAPTPDEARLERQMIIKHAFTPAQLLTQYQARAEHAEWRLNQLQARIDEALALLDEGNPHMAGVVLAELE